MARCSNGDACGSICWSQAEPAVQTVPEESRAQGNIGVNLYYKYLKAGANVLMLLFVLMINLLAQVRSPL